MFDQVAPRHLANEDVLLTTADGWPLRSCVDLAATTAAARTERRPLRVQLLRGETGHDIVLAAAPTTPSDRGTLSGPPPRQAE